MQQLPAVSLPQLSTYQLAAAKLPTYSRCSLPQLLATNSLQQQQQAAALLNSR